MIEEDYLQISGIQHFCFCRRQWALIHIENQWDENMLTAEGQLLHHRVDDPSIMDKRNGVLTIRGLRIKSDKLCITGICDAVEFIPDTDGITLSGHSGTWRVQPVEYKHGSCKLSDCDRLQVAAQAMCLEEMFSCRIETVALFYAKTRRRESVAVTDELREKISSMLHEMVEYYERGYTPKVKVTNRCKNCSLENLCMPALLRGKFDSVNAYMAQFLREDDR